MYFVFHIIENSESKCIEELCFHFRAAFVNDEELESRNRNTAIHNRQLDNPVDWNWCFYGNWELANFLFERRTRHVFVYQNVSELKYARLY